MEKLTRRQARKKKKDLKKLVGAVKFRMSQLSRDKELMKKIDEEMKGKSLEEYLLEIKNNALHDT